MSSHTAEMIWFFNGELWVEIFSFPALLFLGIIVALLRGGRTSFQRRIDEDDEILHEPFLNPNVVEESELGCEEKEEEEGEEVITVTTTTPYAKAQKQAFGVWPPSVGSTHFFKWALKSHWS
jgi:hypothetical protein